MFRNAALIVALTLALFGAKAAPAGPSILSATKQLYGSGFHYRLLAKPLVDAGYTIDACNQLDIPKKLATGKYNVLVWSPMWDRADDNEEAGFQRAFPGIRKAVDDFVARGGGVLVIGPADQSGFTASWPLTEPWGARLLHESIVDSAGEKSYYVKWAYTTKASGPAAPGVTGVWYPASEGKWWWPVDADSNWQIVLRGEPTTSVRTESWTTDADKGQRRTPVTGGVPLAAVRSLGKGRVAILGLPQNYSFACPYSWPGADVTLYAGLDGKPSDGRKVIFNLLRWLSEPSVAAGMGGAVTDASLLKPYRYRTAGTPPPVAWTADLARARRYYRGLAGARTSLSTGRSTVAEYARAARAAGLDFLVFLEDHQAMTAAKNEELRRECARVSDDTFQAIPGMTIADEFGNQWFVIGQQATFPASTFLSPDGKTIGARWQMDTAKHRTLGSVMCDLALMYWQGHVGVGSWNHAKASMPPWDFRDHSAIAVVTRDEGGTVLDDVLPGYLLAQNNGNQLSPYGMELMTDASQVAEHARTGYVTCVQLDRLADAPKVLGSLRGGEDPDQYVTNGPEIVEWRSSRRMYPSVIGDMFRADLYRMQVRIHVRGDALRDVSVYEGTQLMRRYLAHGASEFAQTLELFNIPQHRLVLVVTDAAGRRAISKDLSTRFPDFQEFSCSDRNNQIFNQYSTRPDGSVFYGGPPTGNGVTPDKGPVVWLVIPCYPYAYYERTPKCPWDGGSMSPGYAFHLVPQANVVGEPELPLHNTVRRVLHSPDAMVGEATVDGAFAEKFRPYVSLVWESIFPVVPTRYLEGGMQLTYWRTKPEGYTTTLFSEKLRFKRDVTLQDDMPIRVGTMSSGVDNCLVEIRDSAGRIYRRHSKDPLPAVRGELGDTGYVCFYNKDARPGEIGNTAEPLKMNASSVFFSWTKGMRFVLGRGSVVLYLQPDSLKVKAGTTFPVTILGVGTPVNCLDDAPARIDRALGTSTGRPAYAVTLSEGRVVSQHHILTLAAQGAGVTGDIPKADLPAFLPVIVTGLNDNWTVAHLDRATGKWRPMGVARGNSYAVLDPAEKTERFFLGHPVTCDRREVGLQLTQIGEGTWSLEVHNPTDRDLHTTLSFTRVFAPLRASSRRVSVGAGRSVTLTLRTSAGVAAIAEPAARQR